MNASNATNASNDKYFLITVDVEDWFQVENFRPYFPHATWDKQELRVERNVNRLLDLFDSIELTAHGARRTVHDDNTRRQPAANPINPVNLVNPINSVNSINQINATNPRNANNASNTRKVRATFFVLGWLAERLPEMVREIAARGHEVASHGYNHILCNAQSTSELDKDLSKSKKLLEDITGNSINGYRAPSFSINDEILKTIAATGYRYDSSYNSFSMHGRYGRIALNGHPNHGIAHQIDDDFFELPISNLNVSLNPLNLINTINPINQFNPINVHPVEFSERNSEANSDGAINSTNLYKVTLPWGGGGYFRLIPLSVFKQGVRNILRTQNTYHLYLHPWEIDPDQPKVKSVGRQYRFRHYINLSRTAAKLKKLIHSMSDCRFATCSDYLNQSTESTQST